MTHPITPPPELVQEWITEARSQDYCSIAEQVAFHAAQWGADQELEACCNLLELSDSNARDFLQSARRPKLKSVKEYALDALDAAIHRGYVDASADIDSIRRALEQLDD
jgi:hypothetical protein